MRATVDGVWIGELIYWLTRLGNTSNYSANLHTLQITAANTKFPPASSVFTNRYLATASNSVDFSASRAHVVTLRRISRYSQLTSNYQLRNSTDPRRLPSLNFITPRREPCRQHPVSPVVLLHSNCCTRYNIFLVFVKSLGQLLE
jgi:hypothetical protein